MAEPRAPQRERVDQRLGHNQLLDRGQGSGVEHAAVRAGQVEMPRRAGPQPLLGDLAAVNLTHPTLGVQHRDHQ
ncbi:MAG: hypothetical protein ACRDWT_01060 [Jatrophihabitantaceae bacterium]